MHLHSVQIHLTYSHSIILYLYHLLFQEYLSYFSPHSLSSTPQPFLSLFLYFASSTNTIPSYQRNYSSNLPISHSVHLYCSIPHEFGLSAIILSYFFLFFWQYLRSLVSFLRRYFGYGFEYNRDQWMPSWQSECSSSCNQILHFEAWLGLYLESISFH